MLIFKRKSIPLIRLSDISQIYNSLYLEINEYNTTYWSKFLFNIWFTFGLIIILGLYVLIFQKSLMVIKMLYIYIVLIFIITFLFILTTAASVNSLSNKSYKLLNSLIANIHKSQRKRNVYWICSITKVI